MDESSPILEDVRHKMSGFDGFSISEVAINETANMCDWWSRVDELLHLGEKVQLTIHVVKD